MLRKLCIVTVWLYALGLPESAHAISGSSCAVTVNGSVNVAVSVLSSCTTNSVFINPNINFISGTPMPSGMLITKSSSSGGNATWQISGAPTSAGAGSGVYSFTDSNAGSVTMTINFNIVAPVVVSGSLAQGTAARSYPVTSFSAGGGTGSGFVYAVLSGVLPTGLTLSSAGVLSGSTSVAGTFNFTVQATDSSSNTGSTAFSIIVNQAVTIASAVAISRTVGQTYAASYAGSGGTVPIAYSVSAGALAPGAVLDSTTGALSGTVSAAASGSFVVTVTDVRGSTASTTVNFTTSAMPQISLPTPGAVVGSAYSQTITFVGAISSATLTAGSLPSGLGLTSGGTVVSGTPSSAGTYNFTLSATDSNGVAASSSFSIVVIAPLSISTSSLPSGAFGASYNAAVSATGGVAPVAFILGSGSLPAGLSLSLAGVISGSATAPGTSGFTITATDAISNTASRSLSIAITSPPVAISTTSLPSAIQGNPYTASILASGGAGALAYTLASGALPSGLTLSNTGLLTGNATSLGTFTLTVSVGDAFSGLASATYAIAVSAPPIVFSTASLPSGRIGTNYSGALQATGGSGLISFSISAGALPPTLNLSSGGALTGIPASVGVFNFTVVATDAFANTASRTFSISIISPMVIRTDASLQPTTQGALVAIPFETTGGTAPLHWYTSGTIPPGLIFLNGILSGSPSEVGQFSFTIHVSDATGASDLAMVSLKVNSPVSIFNASLGGPYSREGGINLLLTATGGTEPLRWSIVNGVLPPGVTLNPLTGRISGFFQSTGAFPVKLLCTDAAGVLATRNYSISIANGPQFLEPVPMGATLNLPFRATIETHSALPIVEWQIGSANQFPPGLMLAEEAIFGTPTHVGKYEFELTIRDRSGSSAVQSFQLTVNPPLELPDLNSVSVPRNKPWRWTVPTVGGTPPLRFQWLNGGAPDGLVWNPLTGEISGTATGSGEYRFTLGATDVNNSTASRFYIFRSTQNYSIRTELLPEVIQLGSAVKLPVQVEWSDLPYQLSVSEGQLPKGLALTAEGLAGVPTSTGSFQFVLSASDASGASAAGPASFQVVDKIEIQPRNLDFKVFDGSWFGIPQVLKWVSRRDSGLVTLESSAPWLRVQASTIAPTGFAKVHVDPMLLPVGVSEGHLTLKTASEQKRIPVRVEKLPSDPKSLEVEVSGASGGGLVALLRATTSSLPFMASLDPSAASRFELSETTGEITAPDTYLLALNRRRGTIPGEPAIQLKIENLQSRSVQLLDIPDPHAKPFEFSTNKIQLQAKWRSTNSTSALLVIRSSSNASLRATSISSQPWLIVEAFSPTPGAEFTLKFTAHPEMLAPGIHTASVNLFDQAGVLMQTLPVELDVNTTAPNFELSSHAIALNRSKPAEAIRIRNLSLQPRAFTAYTGSSLIRLDRTQGEIPAGGEVSIQVTANAGALGSWSRNYVLISVAQSIPEIVEVDLNLPASKSACVSSSLVMSFLKPSAGFAAKLKSPTPIEIVVRNPCGETIRGSMLVLRIPGSVPVPLAQDGNGIWHGVWTPAGGEGNAQLEALWLDSKTGARVSRYLSGTVRP